MSYEGYDRCLCKNGHLFEQNCFLSNFLEEDWICPICGEPREWFQAIDQTNCSGHPFPLTLIDDGVRARCPTCHSPTAQVTKRYAIPAPTELEDWYKKGMPCECGFGSPEYLTEE